MTDIDNNKLRIVNCYWSGFVTEPGTYKTREKTKIVGVSLDKKER